MQKAYRSTSRIAALFFVLALAGCAQTPEQVADAGEQFSFRVARTPYAAAICIGRNAKARPGAAGEERTLGESGMEVIVRGSGGVFAVAKILRDGTLDRKSVV